MSHRFMIPGTPVPKPRMTQRDKWQKRPCVMRYRAWADEARLRAGKLPLETFRLKVDFYIAMPMGWKEQKRWAKSADLHRSKPDLDNLIKSVMDALWPASDSGICEVTATKRWDDGKGPRTEIAVS